MQYFNFKGLFVDEDFIINYKKYQLTINEAMFLIQLICISKNGDLDFDSKNYATILNISENKLMENLEKLYKKNLITFNSKNKIVFHLQSQEKKYFTLQELLLFVEKIVSRVITSKELDIITSWHSKKYLKSEIIEAFNISKNINYVNGILTNKTIELNNSIIKEDILSYDWLNE